MTMHGQLDARGSLSVRRRRGACLRLVVAAVVVPALVAFAGVLVSVSPASAAGNGLFSIQPVSSTAHHQRGYFAPVLSPGVPANDQVVVINETDQPMTLDLYAAQAFNTKSGGFALEPRYKPKRFMGAWIRLPFSVLTVPARSGDVVPFTYDPPAHARPGDYAGGIVAVQTKGTVSGKGAVKIQALEAVGTAVLGRVLGPLHARLAVTAVSVATTSPLVSEFGGPVRATVSYTVTNTGNENLTPAATISLSPLLGSGPHAHVVLHQLLPGSSVTYTHTFDGVIPFGHLTATVSVQVLRAQGSGSAGATVIPWGIVGIVVLALLVAFFFYRRRHRRRSQPDDGQPQTGGAEMPASAGSGTGTRPS
jgi:hypothetical protein